MSGLTDEQLDELVARAEDFLDEPWDKETGRPKANTRDFRCFGCSGVLLGFCSLLVFDSVFVMVLPGSGHGCGPRVAAGGAWGSTVPGPLLGAGPPSSRAPVGGAGWREPGANPRTRRVPGVGFFGAGAWA